MIELRFDDFTAEQVNTLKEAKEMILDYFASGSIVEKVSEIDEDGNELKVYGCTWDVELEELE